MKITIIALIAALSASCASTSYEAQEESISFQESRPVNYTLTERVSGEGSAFAWSPALNIAALLPLPGASKSLGVGGKARNQAIGNAVWDNNNVDVVLTPKAKIQVWNFFIFERATAEIQGQGALVQR